MYRTSRSPDNMGLLDPATSDGRVIFFLPWEKMTIAGTTDTPTDVTAHPIPMEEDINFILSEVRHYLSPDVEGTPDATVTPTQWSEKKCFNKQCRWLIKKGKTGFYAQLELVLKLLVPLGGKWGKCIDCFNRNKIKTQIKYYILFILLKQGVSQTWGKLEICFIVFFNPNYKFLIHHRMFYT